MVKVTKGSRWWGGEYNKFVITDLKEIDNHTWVFYKNEKTAQEYNCYVEAFLQRFTELPE